MENLEDGLGADAQISQDDCREDTLHDGEVLVHRVSLQSKDKRPAVQVDEKGGRFSRGPANSPSAKALHSVIRDGYNKPGQPRQAAAENEYIMVLARMVAKIFCWKLFTTILTLRLLNLLATSS